MKRIINLNIAALLLIATTIYGCKKAKEDRTILNADAGAPTLTSNSNKVNVDGALTGDSLLLLNWTKPDYGFDAKVVYQLQFATKQADLGTNSSTSFTMDAPIDSLYQLISSNNIFPKLVALGIAPNDSVTMYVRVKSYILNNPKALPLNSNVLSFNAKRLGVVLPVNNELFFVGDADSMSNWANPATDSIATRLVKISEFVYGGVFYLRSGKEYLIVPVNGSWESKYCLNDGKKTEPGIANGGKFLYRATGGDNFPSPATDGWYKIELNFATGDFAVTSADVVPMQLWAVGSGTPQGWNNGPTDAQKAVRLDCNTYTYTENFIANEMVKFVSTNGAWQPQYGKGSADGIIGYNLGTGNDPDVIATGTGGNKTLVMDFYNYKYMFK
jgi:starch-binding outer membrane protein SusE/F